MAASTQPFKSAGSNLGKTIAQSWSMITGKDVPNYSLLYLDPTVSRKRGEHETIVMPHIVLGRSNKCHVRYSDEYRTVSREHASITVDGSNFVLNHNPAATNPTYVNGRIIGTGYLLQNGDEIQLSTNGPKIRFNTSSLKTSTIGLTSRIGQAIGQAIKPYKQALYILSFLLIASLAFAGYNMYQNSKHEENVQILKTELEELNEAKRFVDQEIAKLIAQGKENSKKMEDLMKRKDKIIEREKEIVKSKDSKEDNIFPNRNGNSNGSGGNGSDRPMKGCEGMTDVEINKILPKDDVVLIVMKNLTVKYEGKNASIGPDSYYKYHTNLPEAEDRSGILYATGFITKEGKLITARHAVQPWRFYNTCSDEKSKVMWKQINVLEEAGATIEAQFDVLAGQGRKFQVTYRSGLISHDNDDRKDRSRERGAKKIKIDLFKDQKIKFKDLPDITREANSSAQDWVAFDSERGGKIHHDKNMSTLLEAGTELYILGFSHTVGAMDLTKWIDPTFARTTVGNDETLNKIIIISGLTFGPGNSGGPAFACIDGEIKCIGVAVKAIGSSNGVIIPISNIRGL